MATLMMPEQLAWLAGFIDGEGSFCIYWRSAPSGNRCLRACMKVGNTHEPTMQHVSSLVSEIVGRDVPYHLRPDARGFRPFYDMWMSNIADLQRFSIALIPYLVTKRRQAELVQRFTEIAPGRGGNHRNPWTAEHKLIADECGDLNRTYSPDQWAAHLRKDSQVSLLI